MLIPLTQVLRWTSTLLVASGLEEEQAQAAADIFARATARGLGHHDISYLPQRLDWLTKQGVNPRPRMECVMSAPASEVWEGDHGLGEVLCRHCVGRAMELARKGGVGYAAVRNSNHFLAAAPYVEIGAEHGFLTMVWSNTDAGMSFPGFAKREIGNNPLGFSIPMQEDWSLTADLCLAYSSLGNLNSMVASGKETPPWWGVDRSGNASSDPNALLEGGIHPIGEHKGFALALLGEILTGVLSGGPTLDRVAAGGGLNTHNQMVLAWDLEFFGGKESARERVSDLVGRMKKIEPGVRIPGERSHQAREQSRKQGVELPRPLIQTLEEWAEKLGTRLESLT